MSAPKKLDQKSAVAPPACCGCSAWLAQHGPAIASHNPTLLLAILQVFAGAPLPILADVAQRLTAEPRIATDQLLDAAKAVGGAAQPVLETVIRAGRGSP